MRLSNLNAATRLGVSPSYINRMIWRGQFKAENEHHGTRLIVWSSRMMNLVISQLIKRRAQMVNHLIHHVTHRKGPLLNLPWVSR